MSKTSISLSDHFDGFIASQIQAGRYDTASEVVRAALRLLEEHETEYQRKLEALREALREGDESGDSPHTIDDVWERVKARHQHG